MKRFSKAYWLFPFFLIFISAGPIFAQVVTWQPQFPVDTDTVTVYFHAKQGSGGLAGYTGDVYAHTGVITSLSTAPNDWRYVKTNWGVNSPDTKMTRIATDEYKITIKNIRDYYGVPAGEKILKMAFVFRSGSQVNGNYLQGKDTGNQDIFVPVYQGGLHVSLLNPAVDPTFIKKDSTVTITGVGSTGDNVPISLKLDINGTKVDSVQNDTISYKLTASNTGRYDIQLIGADSTGAVDTSSSAFVVNPPIVYQSRPDTLKDGITYYPNDPTKVTLSLFAPHKKFVYVIGDFNNWKVDPQYFMKCDSVNADSTWYWITINNLTPGTQYAFQYLINGNLRVADPYSHLILDPANDQYITSATYPNLKPYPTGKTTQIVGVLQTDQKPFQWTDQNYKRPAKDKLNIYELWLDDFVANHDYSTLTDTLNYFQNLGINAIELMPIMEFEGNISWGYNPDFYMAPDKYYGTADELKKFVNACHKRGIAVIMDMPMNDMYGQSPLVRMYFDDATGKVTSSNPWFNVNSPNTVYSYGYDLNYESKATQYFVDRTTSYWVKNFHIDGYRFDFAKGYTNTPGDGSAYDPERIQILERLANHIWTDNPDTYVILELFTANSEEEVLSNYGMMIWGNENYAYSQASMGYDVGPSGDQHSWDFSGVSYEQRGWSKPNLVGYMESHDEERIMYKDLTYGNSNGTYNIEDLQTALNRVKLDAVFFFTVPGPKMIWQFEDLGYDLSINYPSGTSSDRLTPKPIRWDYFNNPYRRDVYKVFSDLIKLKEDYPVFSSSKFSIDAQNAIKRIHIQGDTMDVNIIGNFGVSTYTAQAQFQKTGVWYDYFTGQSVDVTDTSMSMNLKPGECHIYTTSKLPTPDPGILTSIESGNTTTNKPSKFELYPNYPNPFNPTTNIKYDLAKTANVTLEVYNILGQKVATLYNQQMQNAGTHTVTFDASHLSSGMYFIRLKAADHTMIRKMMLLK